MLLEGDQFLSRLTLMFDKARAKGHVAITMKRHDGRTKPIPKPRKPTKSGKVTKNKAKESEKAKATESTSAPGEYMSLIRAVYRNEKISVVVRNKDLNKFQLAYCNLLKSHMDGLKRQKKLKTKKAATQS